MENKIVKIITVLLAMVMIIVPFTSADINSDSELGLTEDVSGGKIAMKQFKLWFTFNQENKIMGEIELAKMRLIQAKIAARNGDSKAIENALMAHETSMERVINKMGQIVDTSDVEKSTESAAKLIRLENAIQVHERRIDYIVNVLETSDLSEMQRSQIESRIQKINTTIVRLNTIQESQQNQLQIRVMAMQNVSEEESKRIVYGETENTVESEKDSESNNVNNAGNKR
jgi:hypothetical protein